MEAGGNFVQSLKTRKHMNPSHISTRIRLISLTIGISLSFIGGRFLLAPETGETGFGLRYTQPNNAFHYIKGIRDIFSGAIIFLLAWYHYRQPLLMTLLVGSIIPLADLLIVWHTPASTPWTMLIHGSTAVTLWLLCYFLARPVTQPAPKATSNAKSYVKPGCTSH